MNQKNLESIKKKLQERKLELEQELERLSKEKVSDTSSQDDGDLAASATMETLRSSLQNTEKAEYDQVIAALQAIQDGRYGICQDCGEDISEKRLQFYPNAARCLACQEALESF